MGLSGLFKSKKEKFRDKVRSCFDESVKKVIRKYGNIKKDPLFGGMMVQAAIGSVYQTLKSDPKLYLLGIMSDFDPLEIIDEERERALNKYLN